MNNTNKHEEENEQNINMKRTVKETQNKQDDTRKDNETNHIK